MKNLQKGLLGLVLALSATVPAFADHADIIVNGITDTSIKVIISDYNSAVLADDGQTSTTNIEFGTVDGLGLMPSGLPAAGIVGRIVNSHSGIDSNGQMYPAFGAPPSGTHGGGFHGITDAIKLSVISFGAPDVKLYGTSTVISGNTSAPDLIVSNNSGTFAGGNVNLGGNAALPPDGVGRLLMGSNGPTDDGKWTNLPANNVNMNNKLISVGVAVYPALTSGSWSTKLKFSAMP